MHKKNKELYIMPKQNKNREKSKLKKVITVKYIVPRTIITLANQNLRFRTLIPTIIYFRGVCTWQVD